MRSAARRWDAASNAPPTDAGAFSENAFAAWAEGRAMTLEQAVAYALDEQPTA